MIWNSKLVRASLVAAALVGGWWLYTGPGPLDDLGHAAALAGPGPAGNPVALSDYAGKVVLVAFWATWCPGCRQEIPDLIGLQEKMGNSGFTVLGVSVDGARETVGPFARSAGINYPILVKPGPPAPEGWSVPGLPIAYLVGRDGTVLRRYDGIMSMRAVYSDVGTALAR